MSAIPDPRYAVNEDGVHIAYRVVGDGPLDLLVCPDAFFASEQVMSEPGWAKFLAGLERFSRLVLFDRRGTGLSDPISAEHPPTLEQWADDAVSVLDALGCEHAALLGVAEGCLVASVLAATHPTRVAALVLVHPTPGRSAIAAEGMFSKTTPAFQHALDEVWNGDLDDVTVAGIEAFAPSKHGDDAYRSWLIGALRHSVSPSTARALFEVSFWSNIEPVLSAISAPTLVLHRTGNRYVPVEYSRHVARCMPHATFVELPGDDHIVNGADQREMLGEIEAFLTGTRREPDPDRVLATIMFTDIVDSTAHAASIGDRAWSELLDTHNATVRRELDRYRGREINTTGDGFVATFDGPARAIQCALAIRDGAERLGIAVRVGAHTGEIELRNQDITGTAVNIAARVQALAEPGAVYVSRTIVDLVAGSGISFDDQGEHQLKGITGTWRLFAVQRTTTA